jgi:hypothetical protein
VIAKLTFLQSQFTGQKHRSESPETIRKKKSCPKAMNLPLWDVLSATFRKDIRTSFECFEQSQQGGMGLL